MGWRYVLNVLGGDIRPSFMYKRLTERRLAELEPYDGNYFLMKFNYFPEPR